MSLKEEVYKLAALAGATALAGDDIFGLGSGYQKPHYQKTKSEQKKCKSCANFVKQCYKGGCPWHSVVDPWQAACKEHYKKKKKKR